MNEGVEQSCCQGSFRAEVFLTVGGWHAAASAGGFFEVDAR